MNAPAASDEDEENVSKSGHKRGKRGEILGSLS